MQPFPILSIVGTTASGKSSFALEFAQDSLKHEFYSGVVLLSADSKQVYQDLEILTGADIPSTFIKQSDNSFEYDFYVHPELLITLHGVSIISPTEEWSVAHFKRLATQVAEWCKLHSWGLIIVGGTGLYHDQLFSTDPALFTPPNNEVRDKASQMSVQDLQEWLGALSTAKLESMNNSDSLNPRRLVRAIELTQATSATQHDYVTDAETDADANYVHIVVGLERELEDIKNAIEERVQERLAAGVEREVERVLEKNSQDLSAATTLGFKEVSMLLRDETDRDAVVQRWTTREFKYAKRQRTWWKKHAPDLWLKPNTTDAFAIVRNLIEQSAD